MAVTRFAAINIGSYELMLKIYELTSRKKVRVLNNIRYVMELGRETYTEQKISFETIEKMCDVLDLLFYNTTAKVSFSSGIKHV